MFRLILLDRDGVINEDSQDYIKSAAEWRPIPGSLEAIASLRSEGRLVGVCTNQSGVGRGIFTTEALAEIHETLHEALRTRQTDLSALVFCPHHPEDGCRCRKPAPGMLLKLMQGLQVAANATCFVGDSMSDLLAAQQAGVQPILVRTGKGRKTEKELVNGQVPASVNVMGAPKSGTRPPIVFDDLQAVANALLNDKVVEPI